MVLVKKNNISELIEDSDVENTKRQRNYAVSRMYLKNYDISCLINSSAKSNGLFCYYIKQIMNVFIRAMVRIFSFGERWNVLFLQLKNKVHIFVFFHGQFSLQNTNNATQQTMYFCHYIPNMSC